LIVNSGITLYIFNEIVQFYNFHYALTNDYIYTGDTTVPILSYGKVDLKLIYNGRKKLLRFKDVAFYKTFTYNLISIQQLNK